MKKYFFIFGLATILFGSGCSDEILNKKPLDQFSDADFWKDAKLAETAVNRCYIFLAPIDENHQWEAFTNNSIDGWNWTLPHTQGPKGWTASDANRTFAWIPDQYHASDGNCLWNLCYKEIRNTNVAIVNLTKTAGESERLAQLLAEAKFIRAYEYYQLTAFYGGVIIIDKPLGLTDELNLPRNSFKECIDFIVKDLDEASAILPDKWDASNTGRVTKGAALALKGRVQLFGERWLDAAATYKKIMDSGTYSLFPEYSSLFFAENANNQEVILDVQFKYPEFTFNSYILALPGSQNGWGGSRPTQNLVDQFELLDGKSWNDPSSIYYNDLNPYTNRDKRFYSVIEYDNGEYFGKRLETGSGMDGKGNAVKGADYDPSLYTGYYLFKTINTRGANTYAVGGTPKSGNHNILIRYAEVLLSYAEAKNEVAGPDASVYSAVNQIRKRAGLPELLSGLSKDQMRDKIRNERRVELCFEWLYYYDCLRWKDRSRLGGNKSGDDTPQIAKIDYVYDLNPDGSVKLDPNGYNKMVLSRTISYINYPEPRVFNLDKDFGWFFPLPQNEIDKNPNLIQNGLFTGNAKQ